MRLIKKNPTSLIYSTYIVYKISCFAYMQHHISQVEAIINSISCFNNVIERFVKIEHLAIELFFKQ